ncbi:GDP-fucose transporter 1-like isoform X1 [Balamuthia mandrillaris]
MRERKEDPGRESHPGDRDQHESQQQNWQIFGAVSFYFISSIALVFLNKMLLNNFEYELPLFSVWFQLIVAIVCVCALGFLGQRVSQVSFIPPASFDIDTAKHIVPLACIFVCMVATSNLTLQFSEVSFYQVVRSLTILFSIALTYVLLDKTTSLAAMRACLVVVVGFVLGVKGEVNFNFLSVVFGTSSSFFVALYSIYVKKKSAVVNDNQWQLLMYNNVLAAVLLLPIVLMSGEASMLLHSKMFWQRDYWFTMIITGVFGFLINIATFLQIKYTSALTHNLSGTAKACVQTVLSIFIWRNPVSLMNAIGIFLVIIGSFWYSRVRYFEMLEQQQQQQLAKSKEALTSISIVPISSSSREDIDHPNNSKSRREE